MPHVSFVALSGFRVREAKMAALGMSMPGLRARGDAIAALPPLGVLTLAALTPDDWSVSLHEAARVDDDLIDAIARDAPTVVAISALTASILEAYALAQRLRAEGFTVVLGGLHVTAEPEEAQAHADAIIVGDGEPVWRDVLADAARRTLRPRYQPAAPFDLTDAPRPRFDLLGAVDRPRYTVQTSRGCPFACDFCAASRLLGPFRTKPAPRVRDELDAIVARAPRPWIELADDNTFARGGPHDALLDALGDSGARWFTEADWRLDENPAVVERLASAGCMQVLVGIESLVHEHTGMGAKSTPVTRMMDAIESIQAAGVAVIACFIVGSDGETHESLAHLERFLDTAPCTDVQLTLQTPFPGTALRRRLEHAGRLLPDRDWSHCTLFDVTYRPDQLTVADLERGFHDLVRTVFDAPATARRAALRRAVWRRHPRLRADSRSA